ncbi:hypothetical protein CISIN_1g008061mg [Citrus sinensis]|uniref:FRIGIDA-like protein n=1 Tax=Citrus sinensis TaxID=2711 RepID=A0A067DY18_CITSI|nr:hypothetical protein CISIN_1g008061mg [Citrus sinensis]
MPFFCWVGWFFFILFPFNYSTCCFPSSISAMEENQSVATLMDSTTSKIQQLQKAFAELESHRAITLNLRWKELEEHFHGLEKSLKRRFHELEDQEKEFETKTRKAREILQTREAAVLAKEQTTLEKLQKKRDAAVFAISTALEKQRKVSSAEPAIVSNVDESRAPPVEDKLPDSMSLENNLESSKKSSESENMELKAYPQLFKLCEEMNSEGLHKFISDNRKNLAVLKEEIPLALKAAADPARLVLDSLEGFYHMEVSNVDGKKDSSLLGLRRTCIMLMECLSILLANLNLNTLTAVISQGVKEQAKAIAEEWKPKLDTLDVDDSNGNSLEAHAFLQLLATFSIASDFNEEELSRLIPMRPRANGAGYGPRVTNVAADKAFYPRVADRYPQYVYDRPYVYTGPADNHGPSLLGSATYSFSPNHGNYFGNGYQYQAVQAPYLH